MRIDRELINHNLHHVPREQLRCQPLLEAVAGEKIIYSQPYVIGSKLVYVVAASLQSTLSSFILGASSLSIIYRLLYRKNPRNADTLDKRIVNWAEVEKRIEFFPP